MCGLRDIPSQRQLIEFEGLESIEDLAFDNDSELDTIAVCNSKRSAEATWVQMGLACTTNKAVKFWISKKLRDNAACDLMELTEPLIAALMW